jgi:cell division septation protein DedD
MGLMQVMPGTYRELQARHGLGDDPYHPYDSLMAAPAYIRQMYDLYGSPAFWPPTTPARAAWRLSLQQPRHASRDAQLRGARRPRRAARQPGAARPRRGLRGRGLPLTVPAGPRRMDGNTRMALAEQRSIREQNAQFASTPAPESFTAPTRMASAVPYASPAPRARGGVVAMEPIPDGSTPEGAMALAASAARQNAETAPAAAMGGEVLPNGSILMARMDPIPDGSTPEGAARMAEAGRDFSPSPLPAPTPRSLARPEPTPFARGVPTPPPAPFAFARAATPVPPAARGFGLIPSATAGTLPAGFRAPPAIAGAQNAGGAWAVQVGAFASPDQARFGGAAAQSSVGGRVAVTSCRWGAAPCSAPACWG